MKGWPIVFRTVVMGGLSIIYLRSSWMGGSHLRVPGLVIGLGPNVERLLWSVALLVWLVLGWRDWNLSRTEVERNR
jgi:hypothetical protein